MIDCINSIGRYLNIERLIRFFELNVGTALVASYDLRWPQSKLQGGATRSINRLSLYTARQF